MPRQRPPLLYSRSAAASGAGLKERAMARTSNSYHFDRHAPQYRQQFTTITADMLDRCPLAWTDTYGGHWVAAGNHQVFELARCPHISNDNDVAGERNG